MVLAWLHSPWTNAAALRAVWPLWPGWASLAEVLAPSLEAAAIAGSAGAMNYSPYEIASYIVGGGQIVPVAALAAVLLAIMFGSAFNVLRNLPRGTIRWSAAALAILAFETPFLWIARAEGEASLAQFAEALSFGVIGFVLVASCTLVLIDLEDLLVRPAGNTYGVGKVHGRPPLGAVAMPNRNGLKPEVKPGHKKPPEPLLSPGWPSGLAEVIVQFLLIFLAG
jgi:hypothetical protein